MADKLKVLLVDYDLVTREGLKAVLESGMLAEVVGVAPSIDEVVERVEAISPDVVITNVQSHNGDNGAGVGAVAVTELVKQVNPDIPVIVLTESENDPFAIKAVEAGISAYILRKNVTLEALESVIQTVRIIDGTVISAPLMRSVVASLASTANATLAHLNGNGNVNLSSRELDVLRLMANGESNEAIGRTLEISHETVRKHTQRVVDKLGARSRTEAAIIGARSGISGPGDPDSTVETLGIK